MMDYDFRVIIYVLIGMGMIIISIVWGATALITHKSEIIYKTEKPLKPDVIITTTNGVSDTLYVYHIPN